MSQGSSEPAPAGAATDTLRRLVVGYDGSDASAAATAFALWLTGKAHGEATLAHVCADLRDAPADALTASSTRALDGVAGEWLVRLENLRDYAAADAAVDCVVLSGRPDRALLAEADARDADLLLVGSTGVGRARGALLGSVSSRLVETARCPVMVFHEGQESSPAHISSVVVGLDGSASGGRALAIAGELARPLGAQIVLAHAYEPSVALAAPTSEVREQMRATAIDILEAGRQAVPGDIQVVEELAEGYARPALAAACDRYGPAVLAVGSGKRSGPRGPSLGGTARWMLDHAPCPVLVARPRTAGAAAGAR